MSGVCHQAQGHVQQGGDGGSAPLLKEDCQDQMWFWCLGTVFCILYFVPRISIKEPLATRFRIYNDILVQALVS